MHCSHVPRNLRAALQYGKLGFPVFRLAPGTKFPMAETHGELDATTDPELIEEFWTETPMAGIACALRFTPWFVLDVDPRAVKDRGGSLWLDAMGFDEVHTRTTITGSLPSGRHYWFQRTVEVEACETVNIRHQGELVPGIDVKGLPYGYVVLPPTRHADTGTPYVWAPDCSPRPEDYAPAVPPSWLIDCLHASHTRRESGARGTALDLGLDEFRRAQECWMQGLEIGKKLGPGRWIVECPNKAQHSGRKKRRHDSSTILLAPPYRGGRGRIWCSHGHCAHVR